MLAPLSRSDTEILYRKQFSFYEKRSRGKGHYWHTKEISKVAARNLWMAQNKKWIITNMGADPKVFESCVTHRFGGIFGFEERVSTGTPNPDVVLAQTMWMHMSQEESRLDRIALFADGASGQALQRHRPSPTKPWHDVYQ